MVAEQYVSEALPIDRFSEFLRKRCVYLKQGTAQHITKSVTGLVQAHAGVSRHQFKRPGNIRWNGSRKRREVTLFVGKDRFIVGVTQPGRISCQY